MSAADIQVANPLDNGWCADPEARIYEGKYIIYVTHSLPYEAQLNHICFVSDDLTHWQKVENIMDMSGFPWVKGAQPIDAHQFKDDDGAVYLLYGGWRHCNIAVMNENCQRSRAQRLFLPT